MAPRPGVLTIMSNDQSKALKIKRKLQKNGQNPMLCVDSTGSMKIKCIINFKDFSSHNILDDIKNDIDDDNVDVNYNFVDNVVNFDVNAAISQAPTIKFSYMADKLNTKIGSNSINDLKLDNDDISNFFNIIEENKLIPNTNNNILNSDIYGGNDEVEKWFFNQTANLKKNIENQFIEYPEEYELKAINLLFNPKHALMFMSHSNCINSILMFHGTNLNAFKSIFETGFKLSNASIGKLYGNGHYFTPQALHAIRYLTICKDPIKYKNKKNITLIAAFVNAGKIKKIKGLEYRNKPIANGYDSHHVKVTDGIHGNRGIGAPIYTGYNGQIMDEYSIKDATRILPRFYVTLQRVNHVFVWRDKNVYNTFNGGLLKEFQTSYDGKIYGVTDTEAALRIIKMKMSLNKVYVITNGANNGELFVKSIRNDLKLKTKILVFCSAVDWHSKWAAKYQNVIVKSGKNNIVKFIKSTYKKKSQNKINSKWNCNVCTYLNNSNQIKCQICNAKRTKWTV